MMKVTLLGTGSPTPPVKRAGSGYLIETGSEVFIFDCGPCSYARFLQTGLLPTQITQFFISHWHYDHCTDLAHYVLQRWDHGANAVPDLKIHGPRPIKQILKRLFATDGVYGPDQHARTSNPASVALYRTRGGHGKRKRVSPRAVELRPDAKVRGKDWEVRVVEVNHCQPYLQTLGYRLDCPGGSLVYSGDSGPCEALTKLAHGADVLIHMCHFLTGTKFGSEAERKAMEEGCGSHMQIAETAEQAGVKAVVLTHITPQLDIAGIRERTVQEMARVYRGTVIFGEDLLRLPSQFGKAGELL